ncbi:hypothetical protein O3M35_002061 [Rhynocoris fuscipes]|uniref:Uncharacterized protein n=1 Tax=Rhynocoris fuscipes TaxID=488301 RepID=A0AAW1CTR6_9HEMI
MDLGKTSEVTAFSSAKDDGMYDEIYECENQKNENEHQSQPPTCQTSRTKKKRISKLSNIDGASEKLRKITDKRTLSSRIDELDVFGKYIASQLMNRLIRQEKIQSMLVKERLNLLESPSNFPSVVFSENSSSYAGDSDEHSNTAEGNFVYIN